MAFTVITPIPLILKALDDEIKLRYSDITTQYDPSMTYEETVKGVRYTRSSMDVSESQVFPLLAFSRSSVIGQVDNPRRHIPMRPRTADHVADQFQSRHCQFDYLFKFYERDVVMADTFEVMFNTHASINDIKTLTVTLPEIGDFEYQCIWNDLDEIEFNKEDNFYISSAGSCTIIGQFVVMEDVPYPLIEQINLLIQDWTHNVTYRTITITAP